MPTKLTKLTRQDVIDTLWEAVNDTSQDPRRIVKACEVILRSIPEENNVMRDSDTAQRFLAALYK